MNSEQFGQILQMVGQAGDGAFSLAIVYMAVGFMKSAMIPATLIGGIACITKTVRYCSDRDVEKDSRVAYESKRASLDWHARREDE